MENETNPAHCNTQSSFGCSRYDKTFPWDRHCRYPLYNNTTARLRTAQYAMGSRPCGRRLPATNALAIVAEKGERMCPALSHCQRILEG